MREKHRIFKCDTCSFTSSSDVGLKIHKTKIHMQVIFKCDRCETKSHEEESLECEERVECGQCDLIFKNRNDIREHIYSTTCYYRYSACKQGLPQFMKT